MTKPEFSIIIPIKNRTFFKVNFEPPGLSIFREHIIEQSNLPKYKVDKRGTDIVLQLLINNLESLTKLVNKYDFEVVIVDFGSTDYSQKKLLAQFPSLKIKIVNEETFFSRGRGLNIGFQNSTKQNVFFCDADMMFNTDEVFISAQSELSKNKVFFPICFDLIEPTHQVGYWRETGYGMMFGNRKQLIKLGFKWSEYDSLGQEDNDACDFFTKRDMVTRYKVKGYFHQWHPSSKFFKNSNYKVGAISKGTKILFNFDESLVKDEMLKYYLKCLREDAKYFCDTKLECDTVYVMNSKLPQLVQKKQIEEYEKKYCRKIVKVSLERLIILPRDFRYFERVYPANPKWLNEVLDWMIRIERSDYTWTLQGSDILPLSAATLFAKLIKIFDNYFEFDKTKLRNIIVKYVDNEDFMFKQNKDNERIISESRQAYSALYNLGYNIVNNEKYNVQLDNYFPKPLYFMTDKYWENPWKAGAHLSHYIFFCHMKDDKKEIENIFNGIKKYAKNDGWYHGNPTEEQIINGIMKVFTAFDVVGKEVDRKMAKGIIDKLLKTEKYEGGCGVYDYVYVLIRCLSAGHREEEIKKRLYQVYETILEYQMPDGGFKYSKDINKKDTYSGKEITPSGAYGSIHATTVFCMALTMMNKALNLGWNMNLAFS